MSASVLILVGTLGLVDCQQAAAHPLSVRPSSPQSHSLPRKDLVQESVTLGLNHNANAKFTNRNQLEKTNAKRNQENADSTNKRSQLFSMVSGFLKRTRQLLKKGKNMMKDIMPGKKRGNHSDPNLFQIANDLHDCGRKISEMAAAPKSNCLTFADTYEKLTTFGRGSFGEVFKCQHKESKVIYACKEIRSAIHDEDSRKMMEHEIETLKKMNHPNLLKFQEVFRESRNDNYTTYLVSEPISGGDLAGLVKGEQSMSEQEVKKIAFQILSAMSFMHKNKTMHVDLKLHNVMLIKTKRQNLTTVDKEGKVKEGKEVKYSYIPKVIDFGISQNFDIAGRKSRRPNSGSLLYMSPEQAQGYYSEKCDIYALGVIFMILLLKNYSTWNLNETLATAVLEKRISKEAKEFLDGLLESKEKNRPDAQQALGDKWFDDLREEEEKKFGKGAVEGEKLASKLESLAKVWSSEEKAPLPLKLAMFVAAKTSPDEDILESSGSARDVFANVDTNNSGTWSKHELEIALSHGGSKTSVTTKLGFLKKSDVESGKKMKKSHDKEQAEQEKISETTQIFFKSIDLDGNGAIGWTEFLAFFCSSNLAQKAISSPGRFNYVVRTMRELVSFLKKELNSASGISESDSLSQNLDSLSQNLDSLSQNFDSENFDSESLRSSIRNFLVA